jgi:hypothetical protein
LSNHHISDSGNGASGNGSSFGNRREIRPSTGMMPSVSPGQVRSYAGLSDFEIMLIELHELFEHDRQVASQPDARRCGICYLHFLISELHYHDEGFYVCRRCERTLGKQQLPLLRTQQK